MEFNQIHNYGRLQVYWMLGVTFILPAEIFPNFNSNQLIFWNSVKFYNPKSGERNCFKWPTFHVGIQGGTVDSRCTPPPPPLLLFKWDIVQCAIVCFIFLTSDYQHKITTNISRSIGIGRSISFVCVNSFQIECDLDLCLHFPLTLDFLFSTKIHVYRWLKLSRHAHDGPRVFGISVG